MFDIKVCPSCGKVPNIGTVVGGYFLYCDNDNCRYGGSFSTHIFSHLELCVIEFNNLVDTI